MGGDLKSERSRWTLRGRKTKAFRVAVSIAVLTLSTLGFLINIGVIPLVG